MVELNTNVYLFWQGRMDILDFDNRMKKFEGFV